MMNYLRQNSIYKVSSSLYRRWATITCFLLGTSYMMFGKTDVFSRTIISNGIPWFDNNGNIVNAHGACIVKDSNKYYLFGEYKSDTSNAFSGFSCYSSTDLVNWTFERIALPIQKSGIMGPNRVGERVKVMKCPQTGEYVMYMHSDNLRYKDPYIAYATSKTINGEYKFCGPLLYNGKPIKRWDMGTFQDTDGIGYLLIHHGNIYRLGKDYKTVDELLPHIDGMGESPAMFKLKGIYYMLTSNLTSWEKNDNFYLTASSIKGPWVKQGLFCPRGKLTYSSQTTFVFPLIQGNDTIPIFMGDRWSYPHQASAATYVWIPMLVDGLQLSIPQYWQSWDTKTLRPVDPLHGSLEIKDVRLIPQLNWSKDNGILKSSKKNSRAEVTFTGRRIAMTGITNCHSGYAEINIYNSKKQKIYSSLLDFYSKNPDDALRFMSPVLPLGTYTLEIVNTGDFPVWMDKSKRQFGSDDSFITLKGFYIFSHL